MDVLNSAVEAYGPDVLFGSYPFLGKGSSNRVIITLEGQTEERVEAAKAHLLERISPECVVSVENNDTLASGDLETG